MIKSDAEIYKILEELIRASGEEPVTCVELMDDHRVRRLAGNANRVSDYLGHMWRRGVLQRWYANTPGRSRYAYTWSESTDGERKPVERLTVVPKNKATKPVVNVTEEDGVVTVDCDTFTITITRK